MIDSASAAELTTRENPVEPSESSRTASSSFVSERDWDETAARMLPQVGTDSESETLLHSEGGASSSVEGRPNAEARHVPTTSQSGIGQHGGHQASGSRTQQAGAHFWAGRRRQQMLGTFVGVAAVVAAAVPAAGMVNAASFKPPASGDASGGGGGATGAAASDMTSQIVQACVQSGLGPAFSADKIDDDYCDCENGIY